MHQNQFSGRPMMNCPATIYVIYDDLCPFCRNYCRLLRLRAATGKLVLVDARKPSILMDEITAKGLDIDQGMVVKISNDLYYGSDAIHILALLSTPSGIFNRLMARLFQSKKLAVILYPLLRDWRNIMLRLMHIPLIKNSKNAA